MFALFRLEIIGGGDAKLAAAAALWIGWGSMLDFSLRTAIYGGALGVAVLMIRKFPLPSFLTAMPWVLRLQDPKNGIPYGIAMAAAAILIFPETALLRSVGA